MPTRLLDAPADVSLPQTVGQLAMGRADPTLRVSATVVLRASLTPAGPASLRLERWGRCFRATAWGPGADWALEHAPGLVGASDRPGDCPADRHPLVARAARRRPGLRIPHSGRVVDRLVATILEQRVTGVEAKGSWRRIVRAWGEPAPGPLDLWSPPDPAVLAEQPYWAFHPYGVEAQRARTIIAACRRIARLEEAVVMDRRAAWARLTGVPGLGAWTAAILMRHARGDADTVEVGDYHLKHIVAWNLAGEARGSDERMLELLAPFAGHRGRVGLLLTSAGSAPPRFGPRQAIQPLGGRRAAGAVAYR